MAAAPLRHPEDVPARSGAVVPLRRPRDVVPLPGVAIDDEATREGGAVAERHRVMLVCSSGGHLAQLLQLRPWWEGHDRVWVSFRTEDVVTALEGERLYFGHHPTTRNVPNLLRNLRLSISVLRRERPDLIVSTGAALAIPFFWVGRAIGCKTAYIEVYDRVDSPTMTGRLCARMADLFLLQWETQKACYPNGVYAGPLY